MAFQLSQHMPLLDAIRTDPTRVCLCPQLLLQAERDAKGIPTRVHRHRSATHNPHTKENSMTAHEPTSRHVHPDASWLETDLGYVADPDLAAITTRIRVAEHTGDTDLIRRLVAVAVAEMVQDFSRRAVSSAGADLPASAPVGIARYTRTQDRGSPIR